MTVLHEMQYSLVLAFHLGPGLLRVLQVLLEERARVRGIERDLVPVRVCVCEFTRAVLVRGPGLLPRVAWRRRLDGREKSSNSFGSTKSVQSSGSSLSSKLPVSGTCFSIGRRLRNEGEPSHSNTLRRCIKKRSCRSLKGLSSLCFGFSAQLTAAIAKSMPSSNHPSFMMASRSIRQFS